MDEQQMRFRVLPACQCTCAVIKWNLIRIIPKQRGTYQISNTVAMEIMWYAYHVCWMAGSPQAVYVNAKQFSSWRTDILMPCWQKGNSGLSCSLDFSSWGLVSLSPWLLISSHGFDWISCCCLTFTLKFPGRTYFGGQEMRVTGSNWIWTRGLSPEKTLNGAKEGKSWHVANSFIFLISEILQVHPKVIFPLLLRISCHCSLGLASFPG